MKLELKHLAPYFPYKVMLYREGFPHTELLQLKLDKDYSYWKPILRPLSDLYGEIEHNGKVFVPNEWLKESFYHFEVEVGKGGDIRMEDNEENQHLNFYHDMIMKLYEWHFDVGGLIEKGLAISVSDSEDLEESPKDGTPEQNGGETATPKE